ncbi:hypothetical protein HMPREF1989_02081, partial [Porphyromonas gingivalis F0566]
MGGLYYKGWRLLSIKCGDLIFAGLRRFCSGADKRLPDDAPKRDMSGQNQYAARLPDGGLAKVVTGCLSAVYKCKMGGGGEK